MITVPKRTREERGILYARGVSLDNLLWVKEEANRLDRTLVNYMDTLITMVRSQGVTMAAKAKKKVTKKVTKKTTTKKKPMAKKKTTTRKK